MCWSQNLKQRWRKQLITIGFCHYCICTRHTDLFFLTFSLRNNKSKIPSSQKKKDKMKNNPWRLHPTLTWNLSTVSMEIIDNSPIHGDCWQISIPIPNPPQVVLLSFLFFFLTFCFLDLNLLLVYPLHICNGNGNGHGIWNWTPLSHWILATSGEERKQLAFSADLGITVGVFPIYLILMFRFILIFVLGSRISAKMEGAWLMMVRFVGN